MTDIPLTEQQRQFLTDLAEVCKTREQWLTLIRFCLPTLIQDQQFLIHVLVQRAEHEAAQSVTGQHSEADELNLILAELGLRLAVA